MVENKCVRVAARPVVIAANRNSTELPGQINHLVGIRAVANGIAEIPDRVIRWRSLKNRLENLQIGVNVGKDKRACQLTFGFWLFPRF